MKTSLNYVRSKVTARPQQTEIQKAVQLAQLKFSSNQSRMQQPQTENY